MKVTLIQPRYFNIWEALGLGYIGAYLKAHHPGRLEMNFFQAFFDTDETIVRGAADSDIVGFSCTSPTFAHGAELARRIKAVSPKAWTVFGGFHPTAVPDDCLNTPGVDQVVLGGRSCRSRRAIGNGWSRAIRSTTSTSCRSPTGS